jgi:hypothetical protein
LKLPIIGILSGVALATLGISSAAQAAILLPSLTPGSQYRLVFVTSGTSLATSTNIADYNQFVNNAAQASTDLNTALTTAGLTPSAINWTAIGSTATVNARLNTATRAIDTSVPIYRVDGAQVATGNSDLWDGSIINAINQTQNGNDLNLPVWTGTSATGQPIANGSLGFNSSFSTLGVRVGRSLRTDGSWVSSNAGCLPGELPCVLKASRPLYGISSIVTVLPTATTTTPEPSSLLSFITLGGLILGGAVRGVTK